MSRKSQDPKLIALQDEFLKSIEEFERWYARTKRAFTALDKAKRKIRRINRRIDAQQDKGNGSA